MTGWMRKGGIALLLGLAGCQTVPRTAAPDVVAPVFPASSVEVDQRSAAERNWRSVFVDPRLQALIEIALADSRDLQLALLDVDAARAQLRIQNAGSAPQVDAQVGYSQSGGPGDQSTGQSTVSFALSAFELDLFGRLRAESDSSFAAYLAAQSGRDAAQIAVMSTVADAYLAQSAAEEAVALTTLTLADWRASLDLTHRLQEAGKASGLDVAQAEGQVLAAEADREAARRDLAIATNALTLAIGRPMPDDLPARLGIEAEPIVTRLGAGVPSDLLERRPDIRQAEHQLAAANADIRAARAAFFPRLSLTAALGSASADLGGLFRGANRTWSFAPVITQPLFNAGRLKGALDLAEIRADQAVATYERTIQTAFREVADGLAGRETYDAQLDRETAAVRVAERRRLLSQQRYAAGLDSRLELLDAQRQLYAQQRARLATQKARLANAVTLYRALGGGLDVGGATAMSPSGGA